MSIVSRAKVALVCGALVGFAIVPCQARAQHAMPLLGEKESAIEAALSQPTIVQFAARPLADVVESLANRHEIQIQFDGKALADAHIDKATPITHHVHDVKLRSALDLLLRDLGLTTVVLDEVLLITTKSEAQNIVTTRVYPVADLLGARDDGVLVSFHTKLGDLTELITSSIKPDSWDETGGPGSIKEDNKSASLVVSQTDAVQSEIAVLLASLRAVGQAHAGSDENEAPPAATEVGQLQLRVYQLPRILHVLTSPVEQTTTAPGSKAPVAAAAPAGAASAPGAPPRAASPFEDLRRGQIEVLKMIESVIEPNAWLGSGGQGVIWAVNDSTLVVRQTGDIHRQIGRLLEAITEADSKRPPGSGFF
jgi:hypothetical protein